MPGLGCWVLSGGGARFGFADIRKTFHHKDTEPQRRESNTSYLIYDIGVEHALLL
jgi:hypothetical protein